MQQTHNYEPTFILDHYTLYYSQCIYNYHYTIFAQYNNSGILLDYISVPPRILIHQYFILKLRQKY